jgi:N-acyl-D-aspartate/D-glutamate deacylase
MTTLIQGGTVYDGTGDAPREADVLIQRGIITRLAPRLNVSAHEVIEARGALVTPGFVDVANYADHYGTLFSDPAGTEPLIRGITSIVVGQGGASQAPLHAHSAAPEAWWGNAALATAHATNLKELFSLLKGRMGVNVGTLVGYATVREGILRGAGRDLTDTEFERMEATLARAMDEGALGISLNLEHPATARIPRHEIRAAARAAAHADGIIALRLRDRETNLKEHFAEALAISEATKANLLVTDLEPCASEGDAYRALLVQITRGSAEHNVHFTTSGTGIAALPFPLLLPPHLRAPEWSAMSERLKEPAIREELRAHLSRYRDLTLHIGAVADPSLKLFEGTPFSKWSLHEHLPFEDALMRLMAITNFRAVLVAGVGSDELAESFADHDRALIASGEAAVPSLESSAELSFLADKGNASFPLEQRVARMTGAPAKKLGLARRGVLRDGYHADVLVIERGVVREAFVNGVRAIQGGAPTGHRGGIILARS